MHRPMTMHRHVTPYVRHCAPCHAAGRGDTCVMLRTGLLRIGLLRLLHGKSDLVDLILRHYRGTARFDGRAVCAQHRPAGDVIAAADAGGRIHLICAHTGDELACPVSVDGEVWSVALSEDGSKFAAAFNVFDGNRNLQNGGVKIFNQGSACLVQGHFKRNEKCTCKHGRLGLMWYPQKRNPVCPVSGHTDTVRSVNFSPDGTKLVTGSDDKTVRIWDAASGEQLCSLKGHSEDNEECICEFHEWGELKNRRAECPAGHTGSVLSVCFDHTGRRLASGGGYGDNSVRLWSTESGQLLAPLAQMGSPLTGHQRPIYGVSFDPKGEILASCSKDKTVRLWDASTGAAIGSPLSCDSGVLSVSWAPDGAKLAAGLDHPSNSVVVFDAKTGEQLSQLTLGPNPELTFARCLRQMGICKARTTAANQMSLSAHAELQHSTVERLHEWTPRQLYDSICAQAPQLHSTAAALLQHGVDGRQVQRLSPADMEELGISRRNGEHIVVFVSKYVWDSVYARHP